MIDAKVKASCVQMILNACRGVPLFIFFTKSLQLIREPLAKEF